MLSDVKKELLNNPDKLKNVLEHFDFYNVKIHSDKYISFGRGESKEYSKKSIVIRLQNNDYLYVKDYAKNINKDIFSYIIDTKKVDFKDIISYIKVILNITNYYEEFENKSIFGGFYEKVRKKNYEVELKKYEENILDKYQNVKNIRFLKDNISLETQKKFNIMFDIESQGIVIPIRDQFGQLIGVKVRCNWEVEDGEQKYYYLVPCRMSNTLFGYSQNYNYLQNNIIYIFESEKSTMQCDSYGIHNCVSLGSGSISSMQVKMLLELHPKKIIFCHDEGYALENIMRNIEMVKTYSIFSEVELGYWDYFNKNYPSKVSPSDLGKEKLEYILENEIKFVGDDDNEEEL